MAQILVRDVDESVVRKLKSRAKSNGRSMEAEIRTILESAAQAPINKARFIKEAASLKTRIGRRRQTDSGILQTKDRNR